MLAQSPEISRCRLSREVCRRLHWVRPGGREKDMSCRVALLRMERDGLLRLPPARPAFATPRTSALAFTAASDPGLPLQAPAGALGPLTVTTARAAAERRLYAELIARYHYLGYTPMAGAQLRYFVHSALGLVAVLGFGASAWMCAPRDRWIGWRTEQRQQRLHLVVNNARFLVPPWVRSPNLASMILGLIARRIAADWTAAYAYAPALLETFVEQPRPGTCYRAANWQYLGETKGRGKLGGNKPLLPRKSVFAYPLHSAWREILTT
jgi:hypothetical protein